MDKKQDVTTYRFGLIGRQISYSFSRKYFSEKFKTERLPHAYQNFDLESISEIEHTIKSTENLKGFNVTIPYKESIIPYLDRLDKTAEAIGAVNTVKILKNGTLKGYNTDYYGFKKSLTPYLKPYHKRALILGTGGASKAIAFALGQLNISYDFISRPQNSKALLSYEDLNEALIQKYSIIINCTPLGTFPNIEVCPNIPYHALTERHLLYDLIYNPEETQFLKNGKAQGACTINGLKMLQLQAEKAWKIWNT